MKTPLVTLLKAIQEISHALHVTDDGISEKKIAWLKTNKTG